jgi:uncharacterized protein
MADKIHSGGITVELESPDDVLLVEAYGDGGFRLMERRVEGSVFVLGTGFFPFEPMDLSEVEASHIDELIQRHGEPEILIIGTGAEMSLLPKMLRLHLDTQKIGYDVMSTGAAARTYNVLAIEGRRVAAILLQVE